METELEQQNSLQATIVYSDRKKDLLMDFSERKKVIFLFISLTILVLIALITIVAGTYDLTIYDVYHVIFSHLMGLDTTLLDKVHNTIVWEIRLPRILVCIMVGIGLATSGATYQGAFRNPLVEPFILGISAGASFGASLGILYPHLFLNIQISAFLFALLSVFIAYSVSRVEGKNPIVALILAGVVISSLFQALVSILKYTSDDTALRAIVFWIMGGFYYANWKDVVLMTPVMLVSFSILWLLSWKLNILSMGDEEARSLGVNPDRLKIIFIVIATLMTAIAVATVGIIAWVGLMMPHAARMVLGPDHRFVLPASAIMGAIYMLICDTLARTMTTAEIPVSIITSLLGAPYLFYLLRTKGRFIFSS
ncbi:MAG: iron ABC transporter permease [Anaerolineaceae bacterium]|nr:iron ABC transporter permease [Anaerolineaceae bacterium]